MSTFSLLAGILLAFLAVVSASPTGTPTTLDDATHVGLGPRRNGYSDLPSDAATYNYAQPQNAIPNYVMASDPDGRNDAIVYRQAEIYTALQQGYEVLQRTRDPIPREFVHYGNVDYPVYIIPEDYHLSNTHFGQFGDDDNLDMYAWPLLWTESYTGKYKLFYVSLNRLNQNPGQDRVVFDENGIYLGVITQRPSDSQTEGGYRWCPPTTVVGRWIARWIGGNQGWDWTGVPPNGPDGYNQPSRWNTAASQLRTWWNLNPGGMPPTGSTGVQVNSSTTPPVDTTPLDGPFGDDNPLQFPPWDNSTGVWLTYVPGNITGNLTHELEAADCAFARDHGTGGYHQSCQTGWGGKNSMQVRITVSGTGQDTKGWCQGIIDSMKEFCGGNFNLLSNVYTCNVRYPGTATFSKATDPNDPGYGQYFFGIDLHFYLQWPWAESDADHQCMSKAVEKGSCGQSNVKSMNGKWCRNVFWKPSPPPVEWSDDMGPP